MTQEHGYLTKDNDLSKTEETKRIIDHMVVALEDNGDNMGDFFHQDFRWMANYGCGFKNNLQEFRNNWQLPLRSAFTDRKYTDAARLVQGEWMASFGEIDALHSGEFMNIAPTHKRVIIKYTDFWKVQDSKIVDNWVTVDFPYILSQLGHDVFNGLGWEAYDSGRITPPKPA